MARWLLVYPAKADMREQFIFATGSTKKQFSLQSAHKTFLPITHSGLCAFASNNNKSKNKTLP
jgi:hypothetical protein